MALNEFINQMHEEEAPLQEHDDTNPAVPETQPVEDEAVEEDAAVQDPEDEDADDDSDDEDGDEDDGEEDDDGGDEQISAGANAPQAGEGTVTEGGGAAGGTSGN
jgi:hypothetical protein